MDVSLSSSTSPKMITKDLLNMIMMMKVGERLELVIEKSGHFEYDQTLKITKIEN